MKTPLVSVLLALVACSAPVVNGQTGGQYDLSRYVIASGGGTSSVSNGQSFKIEGTIGQASAGTISTGANGSGGQFTLRGGFWAFPAATFVSVGGRVTTTNGRGIYYARVSLTDSAGVVRTTLTNPFGYYRFYAAEVGETYVITAASKRYHFARRVFILTGELTDLNIPELE